jgi:serine protease Do
MVHLPRARGWKQHSGHHPDLGARPRSALASVVCATVLCIAGAPHAATIPACDTAQIAARAVAATVNLTVAKVVATNDPTPGDATPGDDNPPRFEVFYGSGVIVDPSGVIVTNKHVIKNAARIWVTFGDRSQAVARLIVAATYLDLAILKVDGAEPRPALRFGDSDQARPGQPVIAIGNPLGIGTSVSAGVVSGLNRNRMRTPFDDFIQTDASINPGNSGGPLLNCMGEVIGINTMMVSNNQAETPIGIGFALPSNDAQFFVHRVLDTTYQPATWIGLRLQDLSPRLATIFSVPGPSGAIVTEVDAGSPAAEAGLATADVVTGVGGKPMSDARAVLREIARTPADQQITIAYWRHGRQAFARPIGKPWPNMMEQREDVLASSAVLARAQAAGVGAHLTALSDADRQRLHIADGVGVLIDHVVPGSRADAVGLLAGDVIERVDDQVVHDPDAVMRLLMPADAARGHDVAMLVRRDSGSLWVTMYAGRVDVADMLAAPPGANDKTVTRDAAAAAAKQ